jgi:hypothetical protein
LPGIVKEISIEHFPAIQPTIRFAKKPEDLRDIITVKTQSPSGKRLRCRITGTTRRMR